MFLSWMPRRACRRGSKPGVRSSSWPIALVIKEIISMRYQRQSTSVGASVLLSPGTFLELQSGAYFRLPQDTEVIA